jgi:hypothetical protein
MDFWGEEIEPSRGGEEEGKDRKLVDVSKNTTQLQEQIPLIVWRVIGENMSLVEGEDDERASWP